mmetsp:Transcript_18848/g.43475  ORF Transcript_18848/g.43475 Transcript_18848/m.43475 type:complete len:120 (-) Transcript_18848:341-700(-)
MQLTIETLSSSINKRTSTLLDELDEWFPSVYALRGGGSHSDSPATIVIDRCVVGSIRQRLDYFTQWTNHVCRIGNARVFFIANDTVPRHHKVSLRGQGNIFAPSEDVENAGVDFHLDGR